VHAGRRENLEPDLEPWRRLMPLKTADLVATHAVLMVSSAQAALPPAWPDEG
jgi:hypothetical protein